MATLVPAGLADWTTRTTPALAYPSVAWSSTLSLFAAVSYSGDTSPVITSPTGVTWTQRAAGLATHLWNDVIWAGGSLNLFVAVSDASGETTNVMTSANGTSWTARTADDKGWIAVAFNGTTLVAVNYNDSDVMTSTDGTTWTTQATTGLLAGGVDDIVWDATSALFIAIAKNTTAATQIYTSPNGLAWTARTGQTGVGPTRIALSGDGTIVISTSGLVGGTTGGVLRSTNGTTYTFISFTGAVQASTNSECIAYLGDDTYAIAGDDAGGGTLLSEDDGLTWAAGDAQTGDWYDAVYASAIGVVAVSGIASSTTDIMTAAFRVTPAVTGLSHLEGESVSVVADGIVLASPNNPAYDPIVIADGEAVLPAGTYTSVTVGLPFTVDVETLDLDSAATSVRGKPFRVNAIGAWLEESGPFYAGNRAPATDAIDTDLLGIVRLTDEDETVIATDEVFSGFTRNAIPAKWTKGGRIFLRQVDPVPLTVLALVPIFDSPERE